MHTKRLLAIARQARAGRRAIARIGNPMQRLSAKVVLRLALTGASLMMTEGSRAQSPQQSNQPELLNAPLLAKVRTRAPATLLIERRDGGRIVVDLGPSIATPESEFAALQDRKVFGEAKVAKDGTAVIWSRGGITISSKLLHSLAAEQFHARKKRKTVSHPID